MGVSTKLIGFCLCVISSNAMALQPEIDIRRSSDFSRWYLNHDLTLQMAPFHIDLHNKIDSDIKRIAAVIPRSMAKSTIFTKHGTIKDICLGDKHKITIVSDTSALAFYWLGEIRKEIESNEWIIHDFGYMKTDKWTERHIVCRRLDGTMVEVRAVGAGAQTRGFRPHKIVIDDLENDEHVRSEDQRAKLKDWLDKALINTLEPDGQLIMLGTMLHPLSLLNDVCNRSGWTVLRYKAIMPNGEPLWEAKWPLDKLSERRLEIGSLAFNAEFMNEPIISENPIMIRHWFNAYDNQSAKFEQLKKVGLRTIMAIDPAISKNENADYTAIVTLSSTFDAKSKHFVRPGGVIRGHWPINRQVMECVRLYDKFEASAILVETVAYQEALAQEIRRHCDDNHRNITMIEIKPDKDKERRAHAVAPTVERGDVFIDETDAQSQRLVDELCLMPTGDHDDLADAFVMCLTEAVQWGSRKHNVAIKSAIPKGSW